MTITAFAVFDSALGGMIWCVLMKVSLASLTDMLYSDGFVLGIYHHQQRTAFNLN